MSNSKSKKTKKGLISLAFVCFLFLGIATAIAGFVLVFCFCIGFVCEDYAVLGPGGQSSCMVTKDQYPSGSVSIEMENGTEKSRLQTLVFTKQPKRTHVDETFSWRLEDNKYKSFSIPAIDGATYRINLQASEEVKLRYIYRCGKKYCTLFAENGVRTYSYVYTSSVNKKDAFFSIDCSKSTTGKLEIVVSWPRWSWNPGDYALLCDSYPCEFELDDPRLVDNDLWFVTVNNGAETIEIDGEANYKFVHFISSYAYMCFIMYFVFREQFDCLDSSLCCNDRWRIDSCGVWVLPL